MTHKERVAIALGTFDGLHKGHRKILNAALQNVGLKPVAVTFLEPPKRYTSSDFVPMLMSSQRKIELLKEMGFMEICTLDYREVHNMTAKEFLDFLFSKYDVQLAVCGDNYRFGKGGAGDAAYLMEYCEQNNAKAKVFPMEEVGGRVVSSTLIRGLISNGEIAVANTLLGKPYSFKTEVIHGEKRGRTLGFPTVNQPLDKELVTPKFGVYASRVMVNNKQYAAVTNIGLRPTFKNKEPISETYILGFEGNLYGQKIAVELLEFLREEKVFSSLEELKNAILENAKEAEKIAELN